MKINTGRHKVLFFVGKKSKFLFRKSNKKPKSQNSPSLYIYISFRQVIFNFHTYLYGFNIHTFVKACSLVAESTGNYYKKLLTIEVFILFIKKVTFNSQSGY